MDRVLYVCDPKKNVKCNKTYCAYLHDDGVCYQTEHEEFAASEEMAREVNRLYAACRGYILNPLRDLKLLSKSQ